jgi:serine/threonine-protein kinase HipA
VIRLQVWLRGRHVDEFARVGELATTDPDPQGRFEAEFAYEPIGAMGTPDLDPASMRRIPAREMRSRQFEPPLAVFDDALPDGWGRRLLQRELRERGLRPSPPEMLRHMGARGLGALAFAEEAAQWGPELIEDSDALKALLEAADAFERGQLQDNSKFRRLLQAGATPGGARPKALVVEDGIKYLAKFPSSVLDEGHDIVGLEAVGLELARSAGLLVPENHLRQVVARRVLLVRRFDVTQEGGRNHMVSFKTLCRERPGVVALSYDELATAVRKFSAAPLEDLLALFRHATFNAAFGNVDDHTKNFWMLHLAEGWRLAPAIDLVPDYQSRGEHCLAFGLQAHCPPRADLLAMGKRWDIERPAEVVDQVREAVSRFPAVARELQVEGPIENIAGDVDRRLALMGRT